MEVDDVLHGEVPGLHGRQAAGQEAEQQHRCRRGLPGHRRARTYSCGGRKTSPRQQQRTGVSRANPRGARPPPRPPATQPHQNHDEPSAALPWQRRGSFGSASVTSLAPPGIRTQANPLPAGELQTGAERKGGRVCRCLQFNRSATGVQKLSRTVIKSSGTAQRRDLTASFREYCKTAELDWEERKQGSWRSVRMPRGAALGLPHPRSHTGSHP